MSSHGVTSIHLGPTLAKAGQHSTDVSVCGQALAMWEVAESRPIRDDVDYSRAPHGTAGASSHCEEFEYEELPEDPELQEDEEETLDDINRLLAEAKPQEDDGQQSSQGGTHVHAQVSQRPQVIDDFFRNFLIRPLHRCGATGDPPWNGGDPPCGKQRPCATSRLVRPHTPAPWPESLNSVVMQSS